MTEEEKDKGEGKGYAVMRKGRVKMRKGDKKTTRSTHKKNPPMDNHHEYLYFYP